MDYIKNYQTALAHVDERTKEIIDNIINPEDFPWYLPNQYKIIIDKTNVLLYPINTRSDYETNSFCIIDFRVFNDGRTFKIREVENRIYKITKKN
jgi:hypothetical protein